MKWTLSIWSKYSVQILAALLMIVSYLFFPTTNQVLDSWEYASNVKYVENLFKPNHLLYSPLMYTLHCIPLVKRVDTMCFMQLINGLFALGTLSILYPLLRDRLIDRSVAMAWVAVVGGSFAMLRFGTENETYMSALFFSVLGARYFQLHMQSDLRGKSHFLVWSGIWFSISILMHQLHILWWLAILGGVSRGRRPHRIQDLLFFGLPALVVPMVYTIVWMLAIGEHSDVGLLGFALGALQGSTADFVPDHSAWFLTLISFVRSFVQVHGNVPLILEARPFWSGVLILIALSGVVAGFWRGKLRWSPRSLDIFWFVHFVAFIMHLVFAFLSDGNVEFMVMMPVLFVILMSRLLQLGQIQLWMLALSLWVWNMIVFVLPSHFYNYQNDQALIDLIHEAPNRQYVLIERNKVSAHYKYVYGDYLEHKLLFPYDLMRVVGDSIFFTDMLTKHIPLSRASIVEANADRHPLVRLGDSTEIKAFYGNYYLEKVRLIPK